MIPPQSTGDAPAPIVLSPRDGGPLRAGAGWSRLRRWAWLPIPAVLCAIVVIRYLDPQATAEPPYLLAILNFLFRTAVGAVVAYLAAYSFARSPAVSVLLLGIGMLWYGVASFVTALAVQFGDLNTAVTIFNVSVCAAAACHLVGAAANSSGATVAVRSPLLWLGLAYTGAVAALALLTYAAVLGLAPVFFDPAHGPTPLRQAILSVSIAGFALAGTMLVFGDLRVNRDFATWYGMGLALIAVGLLAVVLAPQMGGPLTWLGRGTQYLGSLYILCAVLIAARESGAWESALRLALQETEERFRIVFRDAPYPAAIATLPQAEITDVNRAWLDLLGARRSGIVGRRLDELGFVPVTRLAGLQDGETLSGIETEVRSGGGQSRSLVVDARAIRIGGERCLFVALEDVTDRLRAERALRDAHAELEQRVRERTAELERRAEQLAALASELTLAEQRERRRLARMLHDHLQQLLVGAKLGSDLIAERGADNAPEMLRRVSGLLEEAIKASRSLTVELSPPVLHESGLAAALDWLAEWMQETHGFQVAVTADAAAVAEREDVRVLLFEAARELLLNAVKYAGVTRATVELARIDGDRLSLTVADEGHGFDPAMLERRGTRGGFGLFSIRERLELIGGRLQIESAPGAGARLTCVAPRRMSPA